MTEFFTSASSLPAWFSRFLTYNGSMTVAQLRAKHHCFFYRKFAWQIINDELVIDFTFELEPEIIFQPQIKIFPLSQEFLKNANQANLNNWVFHLGLIEMFSYWKVAASPTIVIEAGQLDDDQLSWWKELLLKGMGEFFYTNDIDFTPTDFVELISDSDDNWSVQAAATAANPKSAAAKYLVPVGGGKDSALVVEILEENGLEYDILLSHPQSPAADKIAKASQAQQLFQIGRTFDPKLFELNQAGYLNGHTPFSARLAFESSLLASLVGHQQVLLANEFSANEGNVPFHGTTVNHQYSKTFEFEQRFRQYVERYLSPAPEYLSLLRPLTELQIAAAFAQRPRFQQLFKSCNREQQEEQWCCQCPKCLFVFTVLYPFLEEKELVGPIFPSNLFEDSSLKSTALAMLGKDEHKPFECIGTYEETLAAFQLSIEHFRRQHPDQDLPALLGFVQQQVLHDEPNVAQYAQQALQQWNDQHHLDEQLVNIVRSVLRN